MRELLTVIISRNGKFWHYEAKKGSVTICGRRLNIFDRWLTETLHKERPNDDFCPSCQRIAMK